MKKYKAIFFDWDGTAVTSRNSPADEIAVKMEALLKQGIKLAVISGTTYEKIANGNLGDYFSSEIRKNLYLGLARGAYNYGFDEKGNRIMLGGVLPNINIMEKVHRACIDLHMMLFTQYKINTDIIFNRPNYCKIDLLPDFDRGEQLYFHSNEVEHLNNTLNKRGYHFGIKGLISNIENIGNKYGIKIKATTDAKYLEAGLSTKTDNVDFIFKLLNAEYGINAQDCCFWGDEFLDIGCGIYGSDSYMITNCTKQGDFFDVSEIEGKRPDEVTHCKGGVNKFRSFLENEAVVD